LKNGFGSLNADNFVFKEIWIHNIVLYVSFSLNILFVYFYISPFFSSPFSYLLEAGGVEGLYLLLYTPQHNDANKLCNAPFSGHSSGFHPLPRPLP
jgi:hypothetical protein